MTEIQEKNDGNREATEVKKKWFHEGYFVERLKNASRGDLAILKRACGTSLGSTPSALPAFYKCLPHAIDKPRDQEIYFLVATLFPINPKMSDDKNFGATMRKIARASVSENTMERRLRAILKCKTWKGTFTNVSDLAYRLRQCVKLARDRGIGINWVRLLRDLLYWDVEGFVQKRWARAFHDVPILEQDKTSSANAERNGE